MSEKARDKWHEKSEEKLRTYVRENEKDINEEITVRKVERDQREEKERVEANSWEGGIPGPGEADRLNDRMTVGELKLWQE